MAACTRCGIAKDGLPEGYVCSDCVARYYRPTQKAKDFVEWLKKEKPEVYERALLNDADDQ